MKTKTVVKALAGAALVGNAVHAAMFRPEKKEAPEVDKSNINLERYRKNLSKAVSIKTISYRDSEKTDWAEFERFHAFLDEAYPLIKEKLS